MQHLKLELLHYKNAIFQGFLSNLRKQGEAIVIYDNRAILFGKFNNDQISDQCTIMLEPDTYFMGTFKKGLLDGPFSIRSPRFSIYSQTKMNRVEGQILVIDKKQQRGRVWQIQNGQGQCIREGEYDAFFSQQKIAKAIAPYTQLFPNLLQNFILNSSNKFSVKAIKGKQRVDVSMQVRANRKLTVQFERQRVIASGVMSQGLIYGLGYIYDKYQQIQIQGQLDKSQLHGEGIKHQLKTNRTKYGKFSRGDIRSLDVLADNNETTDVSLNKLKKRIHIHSLQYTNDYINERPIYLLRNFMSEVIQNELRYSQYKRQQSSQQKSNYISRQGSSSSFEKEINEYNYISKALRSKK